MYLYFLYCLCFVNETSIDMLEYQSREERYPDLELEEDILFLDYRENYLKYVIVEKNKEKEKVNSIRW